MKPSICSSILCKCKHRDVLELFLLADTVGVVASAVKGGSQHSVHFFNISYPEISVNLLIVKVPCLDTGHAHRSSFLNDYFSGSCVLYFVVKSHTAKG